MHDAKKLVKILCYLIIKTLWTENMKQFEISNSVRKALSNYLNTHNLNLKAAMDNETTNGEVAAIVHAGLPAMIRKIYSLEKMKTFFWTKKDLMMEFINMRLDAGDKRVKLILAMGGGDRSLKSGLLFSRKSC